MPANTTHPDYDNNVAAWLRARDVIAGDDAIKAAGTRYLPRLDSQTDDEYDGYKSRASFFNATARTIEGFVGMLFRRSPSLKLPAPSSGVGRALQTVTDDVDLSGTSLFAFCKGVVSEVLAVGRCGTLVDWQSEGTPRAYAKRYDAESIINWQTGQVGGRHVLTMVALREWFESPDPDDGFKTVAVEQVRVLKLEHGKKMSPRYVVEIWRKDTKKNSSKKTGGWVMVETRTPLRLGQPLTLIPFVFHGPRHSRPDVAKLPMADIIFINLDHYRLDADYKHGLHFTALPTAWVSGFEKADLRIGSNTAWVAEQVGAVAGFLEFKGQGLGTFENAQSRDERLMAVLGSRMLEATKMVGETAQAIELRQAGENSVLMSLALSVSDSMSQVLRWVYWWNSTEQTPDEVGQETVLMEINTDFSPKGLTSFELTAIVESWQAGAISRETMFDLFRRGEVLPAGRSDEEEARLVAGMQNEKLRMQKGSAKTESVEKENGGMNPKP